MLSLATVFLLLGLAALSFAMDRHAADAPQAMAGMLAHPVWRRVLRWSGVAGIMAALWLCAKEQGAARGVLMWVGLLTPCTLLVACAQSALRRQVVRAGGGYSSIRSDQGAHSGQ